MKSFTFFLLFLILLISNGIGAQDLGFVQYQNAPLYMNPALTGDFEGDGRVNFNFRKQNSSFLKSSDYYFSALSYDSQINVGTNKVGYGMSTNVDRIGGELSNGTNKINVYGSYIYRIGNVEAAHHSIAVGGSVAYGRVSYLGEKSDYVDLSSGLLWKYFVKSRLNFEFGTSIFHFNTPDISTTSYPENFIYQRINFHGGTEIPLSRKVSILPSFLYTFQGPFKTIIFGSEIKYLIGDQVEHQFPFIKLGAYQKTNANLDVSQNITSHFTNLTFEMKTVKIGLAIEYFRLSRNSAIEVMAGYIF